MFQRIHIIAKSIWKKYIELSDRFEFWRNEHKAETRKFNFFGWIVVLLLVIGYGKFFHIQYSHVPDTKVNSYQTWENSSAGLALTSKEYDAKSQVMVLRFKLKNSASDVGTVTDSVLQNKVKFSVQVDAPSNAAFETVPTTDSNYVMVIKNLKKNFRAVKVTATNNTMTTESVESSASSTTTDSGSSKKANQVSFIANYRPKIVKNNLKVLTRREYAYQDIGNSNSSLVRKNKKLKEQIDKYNQVIATDKDQITQLQTNQQYKTEAEKNKTTDSITNYNDDIGSANQQIKSINKKISNNKKLIALNKQKKGDIRSGKYVLPKTSTSVKKFDGDN